MIKKITRLSKFQNIVYFSREKKWVTLVYKSIIFILTIKSENVCLTKFNGVKLFELLAFIYILVG